MNWTIIKESIPNRSAKVADIQDNLSSKLGLKNLLEFLF